MEINTGVVILRVARGCKQNKREKKGRFGEEGRGAERRGAERRGEIGRVGVKGRYEGYGIVRRGEARGSGRASGENESANGRKREQSVPGHGGTSRG